MRRDRNNPTKLSPQDIIYRHNDLEPSEIISQYEKAKAWDAICKTLNEVYPHWHSLGDSGTECAVLAIRNLAYFLNK